MKIILFLQVIYIWVATPENRTNISSFNNELVQQATVMLLEEYYRKSLSLLSLKIVFKPI